MIATSLAVVQSRNLITSEELLLVLMSPEVLLERIKGFLSPMKFPMKFHSVSLAANLSFHLPLFHQSIPKNLLVLIPLSSLIRNISAACAQNLVSGFLEFENYDLVRGFVC